MPSCRRFRGATMSRWEEEKAERSRRSLARLTKALPRIFPSAVLSRALGRPFVPPTPRLAIDSYWGAHLLRVIAWRVRLLAAAKRPAAGTGGSATTARSGCHPHSGRRPRLIGNAPTRWARAFAVCAGNRFIASAGMSICGTQGPTRMRSGTAHAWPHGNSGMRRVVTRDYCGTRKHGAAMKAADGCGRAPKLSSRPAVSGLERTLGCALAEAAWLLGLTKPSGDQSRKMRDRSARPPRRALSCFRTPLIA
jgi:hypothetical protein